MIKAKAIIIAAIVTVLIASLTGCEAITTILGSGEPEVEPVTLAFAYPWDGSGTIKKLAAEFEERNEGIKLELAEGGQAYDYLDDITAAFESGDDVPDVLLIHDTWIHSLAASDYIKPIDNVLPLNRSSEFWAGMMAGARIGSGSFGIPLYQDAGLLYYRTDLIDDPPTTWQQLEECTTEIANASPLPYLFLFPADSIDNRSYFTAELLSSWQAVPEFREKPAKIQEDGALKAFQVLERFIANGVVSKDVLEINAEHARQQFEKGNVLFMWNWSYAWKLLNDPDSPIYGKVGVIPMPAGIEGSSHQSLLSGWYLVIARNSQKSAEAELLIEFLTSNEAQIRLAVEGGLLPSRKNLYKQTDWQIAAGINRIMADLFETGRTMGTGKDFIGQMEVVGNTLYQAVTNAKGPGSVLDALKLGLVRDSGDEAAGEPEVSDNGGTNTINTGAGE
jgi:multiple sugar transport system substrate-binding protein